jgi:ATP-dependent helicase HepA
LTVSWTVGDRLTHRDNPALGVGRIVAVSGRVLDVEFPGAGERLRLAATSPALCRLVLGAGRRVRDIRSGREGIVAAVLADERLRLEDGTVAAAGDLWPVDEARDLVSRLQSGDLDPLVEVRVRLDALHLARLREASGLGSFLGGRIRLFPHQLHVAEQATGADPVRWLLADEVGLGKTVEACLILNHLVRTRRVERCLVVAPATLTVQWLGELWRKYHQVFVLLDDERLQDVARDFGPTFNPFDAHRQTVIAAETLVARPQLTKQAVAAGIDLLIVDEAHRLRRPRGHPGDPAYRAIAPIAGLGRHLLLLTATPLEDDAHGFFRLLQLLRPQDFPDGMPFEERLARGEALPACTSSTRRDDIGGLPPRAAVPVDLDHCPFEDNRRAIETAILEAPSPDALSRRRKADRLRRALASGAALRAVLQPEEVALQALAAERSDDPRVGWLVGAARAWKERGEKTLVFVAHRESLDVLREALSHRGQLATAAFHEDLSPARRDLEVAQFRQPGGASLLVATECGGEGRNFEFCHRLVLFDLPWNPVTVEQRIGRLDRIGRAREVEIVYFRPRDGQGAEVVRAYEAIGIFREPLAGLTPELGSLEEALVEAALSPAGEARRVETAVAEARAAHQRVRAAAYRELHRNRFRKELAAGILARVPEDLDGLLQDVVTAACAQLGFHVEHTRGRRIFAIELGHEALVSSLPGVPGGSSFLGTFDREEGVADETLDFFASGHPLVEGILAHLDDSVQGRVSALRFARSGSPGLGLLAVYRDATGFEAVAIGPDGLPRPDWAEALARRPLTARPAGPQELAQAGGAVAVRRLADRLDPARTPVILIALV